MAEAVSLKSSCLLCTSADNEEMVQCDECNEWFHFVCVNVTAEVEHMDWACSNCQPKDKPCNTPDMTDASKKYDLTDASKKHDLTGASKKPTIALNHHSQPTIAPNPQSKLWSGAADNKASELTLTQISARQVVPHKLPIFSGKPEEWPLFISSYEHSTKICGFSQDENLLRLQCALKGKALEYVKGSLMIPELVPEIISTLRMVFGRPEQIVGDMVARLRATAPVNSNKLDCLIEFALQVKNMVAAITASNLRAYMDSPLLMQELIQKLPPPMRLEWAVYARKENSRLDTFSSWLYDLATAASSVLPISLTNTHHEAEKKKPHRVNHQAESEMARRPKDTVCSFCGDEHQIVNCESFSKLPLASRWEAIKKRKMCRTCLNIHDLRFCPQRKACGVNHCSAKHHPLLHKPGEAKVFVVAQNVPTSRTLFRIAAVTIHGCGRSVDTFAFFDEGSAPTLIEAALLRQLGVKGKASELCLKWTDGTTRTENNSECVSLKVSGSQGGRVCVLNNVRSVEALDLPTQTLCMNELAESFHHLKGLPIRSYKNAVPRLLIGLSNKHATVPLKFKEGKSPTDPVATMSRLGWTVHGAVKPQAEGAMQQLLHICECDDEVALQKLILSDMKQDEPNQHIQVKMRNSNVAALEKGVNRCGKSFVVQLLWKSPTMNLPDTYEMAVRRLICLESKLIKEERVTQHIRNMVRVTYASLSKRR